MNLFEYAFAHNEGFKQFSKDMSGYDTFTTFVSDLVIAEVVSKEKGLKDTFKNVTKEWLSDYKYYTEFVMALNWLCWVRYEEGKAEMSKVYSKLFYLAKDKAYEKHGKNEEAVKYIFEHLD